MNIVFEGIDGCGKSTHAERLAKDLGAKLWKFPNKATRTGELIYEHLAGSWTAAYGPNAHLPPGDSKSLDSLVFQCMQAMNRYESAGMLQEQMNSSGVVVDRYWPSGYAYGKADGLHAVWLERIHQSLPVMDLMLLLDADVSDSAERRPERRDRYEKDEEFLKKVMENYRTLWKWRQATDTKTRWVVINARKSKDETYAQIDSAVKALKRERSS